jgi:beta-mannanase
VKKVLAALLVLAALFASVASSALADEAADVAAVPVVDALNRTENPLSNSGKWVATQWATGVKTGADYGAAGWGPSSAFLTGPASAYWSTAPEGSGKTGTAAGLTLNATPEIAERYVSVWLDMPNPGTAKSGYELRWTLVSGLNTYSVKLSKWVAGSETVLASNASVSIPSGTRMMISDSGGTVTAWKGSGSTVSPLLIAGDSTYSSGYAGIEAAGNISRSLDFRAGAFNVTPSVYWGAWMGGNVYSTGEKTYGDAPWDSGTWNLFEEHAGKKVSIAHFGQPAPWTQAFAESPLKLARERGAIPLLSMGSSGATLKEIAEGKKDSSFEAWAKAAKNYAHPFFFRWNWDINTTGYTWGKEAAESPTVYKEAWWHIHDVVEAQGATNVTWVWCPKAVSGGTSLSSLYPGKESEGKSKYVDWTCASVYNYGTNPANPESWKSFSTVFSATYGELLTLAPGKPVMVAEAVSSEYGGSKASWITDALSTQVPTNFPAVKALVWWNKYGGGSDWPIETSASAQTAFANSIASANYADDEFGGLSPLTPISPLPVGSAPAMPTVSSVTPTGPANNNSVTVKGTAPAGTAVHLYTESSCAGMPIASAMAATYAASGIKVSVADNTTTTFYADASNSWGASPCSTTSVTYTEDSTPPAKPSVTSTNPASPANNNAPKVIGGAEAGSTVKLYTNNTCTSGVAATGTAAAFASPGLAVSVADNTTTTYYATATDAAGNVSGCSAGLAYVEDSTAPAAPTVSSTSPASGTNDNSPKVIGSAVAGTTVKIYSTAGCTGSPLATGTAAAFASPGIAASVGDYTTTTFRATATDAANNTSGCSATSVTYVEGTPKVYWGAWTKTSEINGGAESPWTMATQTALEEAAGKTASLIHWGSAWEASYCGGTPQCEFPTTPFNSVREHGSIPFYSWAPDFTVWPEKTPYPDNGAIAAGAADEYVEQWAEEAKAWGHPFFLRFAHEMNGGWFPWGLGEHKYRGSTYTNTAAEFVSMWQHVHDVFEEVGATNVTWVWCPNIGPTGTSGALLSELYPGDEYVDWTCLDGYNGDDGPGGAYWSFSEVFGTPYGYIANTIAPSKPMVIGETAATESGGSKPNWITSMGEVLRTGFPKVHGLVWFNKNELGPGGKSDWPMVTTTATKEAFAAAVKPETFVPANFKELATSPIPAP